MASENVRFFTNSLYGCFMETIKGLERYCSIVNGKEKAKYLIAKGNGTLEKKIEQAEKVLRDCHFCERDCRVDRIKGEVGFCRAGKEWKIFGAHSHYGEEPELVPSATLFAAACTMRCCYCQNAPESISPEMGKDWSNERVAEWIKEKQAAGCRNVNFVGGDPAPFIWNILKTLQLCSMNMPVVFNSNSYYSKEAAEILKDVVDVYLLDFRYFRNGCAEKLSAAPGYAEAAKRNFMDASKDSEVLVRLLVMPSHIECCAKPILKWIAGNLGKDTRVNILEQYRPMYKAFMQPEIHKKLTMKEFQNVMRYAAELGLWNLV